MLLKILILSSLIGCSSTKVEYYTIDYRYFAEVTNETQFMKYAMNNDSRIDTIFYVGINPDNRKENIFRVITSGNR